MRSIRLRLASALPVLLASVAGGSPTAWSAAGPADAPGTARTGEVRILAGGDVTLGYHLPTYFAELRGRGPVTEEELLSYPFRRIAAEVQGADLFWINLETTLTRHEQGLEKNFRFRADPRDVAILTAAGVDVACLANNHAFDFGAEGLTETLDTLRQAGIIYYGAGPDAAAARRPAVVRRGGLDIGFLGYVYLGPESSEPAEMYAGPSRPGVAGSVDLDELLSWVEEDVEQARAQVDLLLVSFHWGIELTNRPLPAQRRLALQAVTAGADVVVGHHPHTLQAAERIEGKLVAYSLGNLMFAGNWSPRRKEAALLEIRARSLAPGRPLVGTRFLPISVDQQPDHPFQPWFLPPVQAARVRRLLACYGTAQAEGECEESLGGPGTAAAPH